MTGDTAKFLFRVAFPSGGGILLMMIGTAPMGMALRRLLGIVADEAVGGEVAMLLGLLAPVGLAALAGSLIGYGRWIERRSGNRPLTT